MSDLFFGINMQKLLRLGVLDPGRLPEAHDLEEHKLSSEEHLFCRLWSSDMMRSQIFGKDEPVCVQGQAVTEAFILFQGQAQATFGDVQFQLGPGAVIGLAEGIAGKPYRWTVHADSILHTRSIPIRDAVVDIRRAHEGLRSICNLTVSRILALNPKGRLPS